MIELNLVGHDPSLRHWGIAVGTYTIETASLKIDHIAVIEPVLSKAKQIRQNSLDVEASMQLFKEAMRYSRDVDAVFAEVPVGSQSSRAMTSYGVCVGVLGSLKGIGIPIIEITPTQVKVNATGSKTATKEEMIAWALAKHPEANWPMHAKKVSAAKAEHMADAIACIYAGIATESFQQLISLTRKFYHAT